MIPLRSTERVYSRTPVTLGLIGVNVAVFLYQASLSTAALNTLIGDWGIVPDVLRLPTLATSMFLHGGWLHLLGNALFLWVFGRNLEDLLGARRYLLFYVVCGIAAGVVHVVANPYSRQPAIGASGAIAGLMGAYLLKFPNANIITLVPVLVFVTTFEIPAPFLLVYWLAMQFFSGLGSLSSAQAGSGVAWFEHIGGFIAGALLIRLFKPKPRWRNWYDEDSSRYR